MPDTNMTPAPANMRIWDRVSMTDPTHTKHVSQRGGFTSIDAQYQVQRATEVFGPVGYGWGYDVTYRYERIEDRYAVIAEVSVWHSDGEGPKASFGPVAGMNWITEHDKSGNLRYDDDAPKKALTDALTKALSHLGFSADVFLGLFDDNKYVAKAKATSEANKHRPGSSLQAMLNTFDPEKEDLKDWSARNKPEIDKLSEADKNWLRLRARQRVEQMGRDLQQGGIAERQADAQH